MILERRAVHGIEVRMAEGEKPVLTGYAAVFNKRSLPMAGGLLVEVIEPGAFSKALKDADIRAFDSHDQSKIVGRQSAGTLKLKEDEQGLRVEITPPDTQVGRDLVENVRNGNLDGMSIGFTLDDPDSVQWDFKVKPAVRHIKRVGLVEVSVVAIPAFPDTSVALRSLEAAAKGEADAFAEFDRLKAKLDAQRAKWTK